MKAMNAEGGHHLDAGFRHHRSGAFNFDLRPTFVQIEELDHFGVLVDTNMPLIQAAALQNRFAVQQVRRRPAALLAIELKYRNSLDGRHSYSCSVRRRAPWAGPRSFPRWWSAQRASPDSSGDRPPAFWRRIRSAAGNRAAGGS